MSVLVEKMCREGNLRGSVNTMFDVKANELMFSIEIGWSFDEGSKDAGKHPIIDAIGLYQVGEVPSARQTILSYTPSVAAIRLCNRLLQSSRAETM